MEWEDKGGYLEYADSLISYRVFKVGKRGKERWVLQISFKDDPIPEQRFFYSKTATINHANILMSSTDPTIFNMKYTESGKIKEKTNGNY